MIFKKPEPNDKVSFLDFLSENADNGEVAFQERIGIKDIAYEEWVKRIKHNADIGEDDVGRSLFFLCYDGERLVGILFVRLEMSNALSMKYGDIGYRVRPSERGKGYATKILAYGLEVCKNKGKSSVILGCNKDNIASAKTIIKNGGELICEVDSFGNGKISQYYSIKL